MVLSKDVKDLSGWQYINLPRAHQLALAGHEAATDEQETKQYSEVFHVIMWYASDAQVSDRSQPTMTVGSSQAQPAGCRSLGRRVRGLRLRRWYPA